MSMAAEPKLLELSPLQLMKMDEVQLGHRLVEFEKGAQVAPGDPLKTLLLFDAWKQQHAKMAPEQQQSNVYALLPLSEAFKGASCCGC